MEAQKKTELVLIASSIAWLTCVGAGLWILWDYENSPGVAATAPIRWPADGQIPRAPDPPGGSNKAA